MTKILIAEDERDIRDLITFTLRFGGYEVVAASNGEEAVAMAKQEIPDMILLDVRMPRMTGYEACAAIKAVQRLKDIPVIFLSAKGQESEIQAGLQAGAAEYLLKPFAPDQLISRIKSVLSKTGGGATAAAPTGANPPAVMPAKPAAPAPTAPVVAPPAGKPAVPFTPAPPPAVRPAEERRPVTGPIPARPAEPKPAENPPMRESPAPEVSPSVQPPQAGPAGTQPAQPPPPAVKPAEERPADTVPGSGGRLESSRIRRYLFGNRTPTPDTGAADDKPADGGQAGGKPSSDNPPDISKTWHQLFGAKPAENKPEENKPADDTPAEDSHPSGDKPSDETPPEA